MSAEEKRSLWAQVYAAVIGGLSANPEARLNWENVRDRAKIEANAAVRTAEKMGLA